MKTVSTVVMVLQALVVGFIAWRVLGPPTAPLEQPGAAPDAIMGAALQELGFPDPATSTVEVLSATRNCGVVAVTEKEHTAHYMVYIGVLGWATQPITDTEVADACR